MYEISKEIASLTEFAVTRDEVAGVLSQFRVLFDSLTPAYRSRALGLLVEQIAYNREKGTVAISFHPSGIKTLAEENL